MDEPGIRGEPSHKIVDRFITVHRLRERRSGLWRTCQIAKLAFVGILKRDTLHIGAIEIASDRRIVETGIKIGEIPFGQ